MHIFVSCTYVTAMPLSTRLLSFRPLGLGTSPVLLPRLCMGLGYCLRSCLSETLLAAACSSFNYRGVALAIAHSKSVSPCLGAAFHERMRCLDRSLFVTLTPDCVPGI